MTNLPAHLLNRKSRGLTQAAQQGLAGAGQPYVSIKANRFTLIDGAGNEKPVGYMDPKAGLALDVVIVDVNAHVSKIYYEGAYDPNATEFVGPTCFSDNGVGASAQAKVPQHQSCMTCPHNQWGSATSKMTGKQTKECNDVKKVAVLVPSFDQGKMVFQLRVPPASLKNWKKYAQQVGAAMLGDRPFDLSDVVTRVSFEGQGILAFSGVSYIDEATVGRLEELDDGDVTSTIVGRNDVPVQGQIAAPAREPYQEARVQSYGNQQEAYVNPLPTPDKKTARMQEPDTKSTRMRGRPPKQTAPVQPSVQDNTDDEVEIPSFLTQSRNAQAGTNLEDQKAIHNTPVHKPDTELQAALNAAFDLPT